MNITPENTAWLVWSNEHDAWWRPNSCGYTQHIKSAGRYSYDAACKICSGANLFLFRDGQKPNETMYPAHLLDDKS